MTDPDARKFLIGQLNGRVLPVPGVDWLHLEVNTGGDNLMLGLHVDVGRLLPPILGFGPGSPSAIGGPPQPEPFVPGQRKAAGAPTDAPGAPDLAGRIAAAAGGGSPLQPQVQRRLESGLGADLSAVRVHTGGEADQLAGAVDAVAFTTGSNIFFRSGEYNPDSEAGLGLLAHEAAHTIQQAAGPVAGTERPGGVAVSDPSDSFEQAADQAAAAVLAGAAGAPAGAAAAPAGAVQRQADPNRAGAAFAGLENRGPIVAQRNITGFLLGASGTLSINMQDQQDVPSGGGTRTGVSGTITYSPDPEGPYSNKIGLIQVIKVTKEKGADVDIASLPTAYGPRLRTKEDTAAGVEGGYYTDILHNDFSGTGKDRPEKSAASPYYEFGPSGPTTQIFGYRRSEKAADIKDAEIGDFPATGSKTDNIDWAFETVAKADDTQQVFGAAKWGFGVHADKIVNEHVDFFPGQSATFDAAMEKHREFYTHEPVTFYFDFNSATPNATELAKIDEFLPYVTRLTDVRLNIQGFADEKGDAETNEAISRRRADAIATAIRGRGVDTARITVAAPGGATTSFTADATTTPQSAEPNRRGNRRVMVTFERGPAAGP
jgi:outer membrane protein OmpA-like peptidoglycan-associated protein